MLRSSHILMLTVVALLGIAVIMVQSAGMTIDRPLDPRAMLLSQTAVHALLAIGAMILASRINVRELFRVHGLNNSGCRSSSSASRLFRASVRTSTARAGGFRWVRRAGGCRRSSPARWSSG
jgi:cell division protein FtsW (lipid II flippase)